MGEKPTNLKAIPTTTQACSERLLCILKYFTANLLSAQ